MGERRAPLLQRHPYLGRALAAGCIALAAWLLTRQLRHVEWASVATALRGYTLPELAIAFGLAATSHSLYACYELIGRRLTHHGVPPRRTLAIGAVSYAFNLSLGTLIGGFATRLRLYTRHGLAVEQVTQVISISVLTNWVGYLALAGTVLLAWPPVLPPDWGWDGRELRALGGAMLAAAIAYLTACVLAPMRRWTWRDHTLTTPSARIALLQVTLAALNWLTVATLVWWLLQRPVEFPAVAAVFLTAAVAGIVVRVPAGLGVIETVFLALLAHRVPAAALLAGLIVHRVVYYLVPLAVGGMLMLWLEHSAPAAARKTPVRPEQETEPGEGPVSKGRRGPRMERATNASRSA